MYFDAHIHLAGMPDIENSLEKRRRSGVAGFVASSAVPQDWDAVTALGRLHDVYPAIGLHPWAAAEMTDDEIKRCLLELAYRLDENKKIIAVSECGLDANRPNMPQQRRAFECQLKIARERGLPVFIHCCKAFHLIQQYAPDRFPPVTVFHGFTGSIDIQRWIIARGYYVSLGRALLRKNPPVLLPELDPRAFVETDDERARETSLADVAARRPGALIAPAPALAVLCGAPA